MKKIKKSVKTAVVSGLLLTSAAGVAYAEANNKSTDIENQLKLDVQKIDSDTVKVSIDNVKDIAKSMQFNIKLEGAELQDGENSIKDLVNEQVQSKLMNNEYSTKTNNILTDYTYNQSENTIDVLITSENSLPKIGDKIEIFELDVKSTSKNKDGLSTYKVVPTDENSYKFVSNTNKEYSGLGVSYDDVSIDMNVAPTITSSGKYIEINEGDKLNITADTLGIVMEDKDGPNGLKLEVINKSKNDNKPITEFTETTPGIYELECTAIDNYNEKSQPVVVQVNVLADKNVGEPTLTTQDSKPLEDITINAGEVFKPLDYVSAVDAKGRQLEVKVAIDKALDLDPEETTDYLLTYSATDMYNKTIEKQITLTVVANTAPVINGVKDYKLSLGDSFDPTKGVTVKDKEDDGNSLKVKLDIDSNVNTNIAGNYQVSYIATDSQGKTTKAISKVVVNKRPTIIIQGLITTITEGDKFDPLFGVKAYDNDGKEITSDIKVSGTVNTSKAGEYELVYEVSDSDGRKSSMTVIITVLERKAESGNPVNPEKPGDSGNQGSTDNTENQGNSGNAGNQGSTENSGNTGNQGSTGNNTTETTNQNTSNTAGTNNGQGQQNSTEVIVENKKPVITVTSSLGDITVGDAFNPLDGISAYDEESGDLTNKIVVYGSVDTSKAGKYQLVYTVEDENGNKSTFTRVITVNEKDSNVEADNNDTDIVVENKSNNIIAIAVGCIVAVGAAIAGYVFLLKNKKK